jgi:hypothetical protein
MKDADEPEEEAPDGHAVILALLYISAVSIEQYQ